MEHIIKSNILDLLNAKIYMNPITMELKRESEEWFSKFAGFEWKDKDILIEHMSGCFLLSTNRHRIFLLIIYSIMFFCFDDYMDKDIIAYKEGVYMLKNNCEYISAIPIVMLFKEIFLEIQKEMPTNQYKRFVRNHLQFFTNQSEIYQIKERIKGVNTEEYLKIRRTDIGLNSWYIMTEFVLEIEYENPSPELNSFIDDTVILHIMLNDTYSYNRDLAVGSDKFNYVYVLSEEKNISTKQAFDLILKQIIELEDKINLKRVEFLKDPNIPENYLHEIHNTLYSTAQWYKQTNRYKTIESSYW